MAELLLAFYLGGAVASAIVWTLTGYADNVGGMLSASAIWPVAPLAWIYARWRDR